MKSSVFENVIFRCLKLVFFKFKNILFYLMKLFFMYIVPVAQFQVNIAKLSCKSVVKFVLSWYARQERLPRKIVR